MTSSAGTNEGGHYGRVFSLSFSLPFIDDDDDFHDDFKEDEEEVNAQQNPLTEMRTTTTPKKKKMKKRRRKRFLATSGEDDCVRLWVVHASSSSSEEEQRVKVEPKPFGLSALRGHSDAVLKCAFGLSRGAFDDDDDDDEKCCENKSSFALATGSSNGEVFVWRVVTTSGSGKSKSGKGENGDRLMAKFNANRKRAEYGISNEDDLVEDAFDGKDDEKDNDNNEVYGLKFLGGKDEYLVIATDAQLSGVEVTRWSADEKDGGESS